MAQLHPPLIGATASYEHSLWDEGLTFPRKSRHSHQRVIERLYKTG